MEERYKTLYEILNKVESKKSEIEKDLKIKDGKSYNEIEHILFGLGLAQSILMEKIDEIENGK